MKKTIFAFALVVMLLMGCEDAVIKESDELEMEYTLFYVDGMPCIWAQDYRAGGLSCDWSRWKGE